MAFFRLVQPKLLTWLGLVILPLLTGAGALARPEQRIRNITYVKPGTPGFDAKAHQLDLYRPRRASATLRPVVVFIHGGNWTSGSKNLYAFIGRKLAKQRQTTDGVVTLIINYRLAPTVQVPAMADDCARAVLWAVQHSAEYGGDPNRIFVMGHSAGGGLAALLATDDQLFRKLGLTRNPVKGAILDDPAGLDMLDYLQKMAYPNDQQYLVPFGGDPVVWRAVSPFYYLSADTPPMLLYTGGRTYPSITQSTQRFYQRLQALGITSHYRVIPRKKHVGMVLQLVWKRNSIYQDLLKLVSATH